MESTIFKNKHHYRQQNQNFTSSNNNNNYNNNNNINNNSISSHNYKNQNSIFILNTTTNNILPTNPQPYYSDLNDNNVVSLTPSSSSSSAASSVWSSASSTMCSPAAHAIQKLFSCSSSSLKLNQGNYSGIESKTFKPKSEILKKKSKFWKYLEDEINYKNNPQGIDDSVPNATEKRMPTKSFKSKYWSKSCENQPDLSELLEYSCSLCDNCRCMDCQIGYFDCENSDDSSSEYSFHLSAYDEDEPADNTDNENVSDQRAMELKASADGHNCSQTIYKNCYNEMDAKQSEAEHLELASKLLPNCSMPFCVCNDLTCTKAECCQQCCADTLKNYDAEEEKYQRDFATQRDH